MDSPINRKGFHRHDRSYVVGLGRPAARQAVACTGQLYSVGELASWEQHILTQEQRAGRCAVKLAVARAVGGRTDLTTFAVDRQPSGALRLRGLPGWYCSLTHSDGIVAGAVSTRPVGVDLELIRSRDPTLIRLVAHDREQRAVRSIVRSPAAAVTLLWTLKEAVLKGMGLGLRLPPRAVLLTRQAGSPLRFTAHVHRGRQIAPSVWQLYAYRRYYFFLTLAYAGRRQPPPIFDWHQRIALPVA